jgi:hypothetical protein
MFGMFSKFEREMIVARLNAGLARRDEVIFPSTFRQQGANGRHRMRAAPISPQSPARHANAKAFVRFHTELQK